MGILWCKTKPLIKAQGKRSSKIKHPSASLSNALKKDYIHNLLQNAFQEENQKSEKDGEPQTSSQRTKEFESISKDEIMLGMRKIKQRKEIFNKTKFNSDDLVGH